MNIQFIDLQMQGDLGDMSLGLYADWAHAKGKTDNTAALSANFYGSALGANTAGKKYDAFSVRAELKPIDRFIIGIGYGYQKLGQTALTLANDVTVKTLHLAATYEIYQNMELNMTFDNVKTNGGTRLLPTSSTTRTTFFEVEALM